MLKKEYYKMCGFVWEGMSLAIVRSKTLFLQGPQYKEALIHKNPELEDRVVMALIVPWRGYEA